ncbi:DUF421 domain-containing protein [Agromyces sp. Marseille-P2726]|uniref:DUF421 domain-containing protein n=1 Tax=Agromyces sp. Marseille-P2726 TaxID=2709132 RepID=UPI001C2DBC00|nr:YetF domain-containing protein [Agromyces sp. Marseille-P2726]
MDIASIFEVSSVWDLFLRGTLIFLGLTVFVRLTGQREAGSLALTDLLVVVLLASAVGHAFAPESTSVTDALILAATILGWSVALDALAYRFPWLRKVLKPSKRPLIDDGELNRHQMRREFLTREEVEAQLRLQGIESIDEVRVAYLEANGMISAFRKDDAPTAPTPNPPER